jgi:hypothetical protein
MRTRNLVIVFFMTVASIVSGVLFWLQDEASVESPPPTASSQAPVKAPSINEGTPKIQATAPPAAAPDLKSIAIDPNKPRPMPAIADTMPSSPPPMPMTVPAMPSDPPAMPNLVMPSDGSMPYDPSVYDPKTQSKVAQNKTSSPQSTRKEPKVNSSNTKPVKEKNPKPKP